MNVWRTDPDVKGRLIGAKSQMSKYDLLFGLDLCERILKITDNLNKIIQNESMSASEAQSTANQTVLTLKGMRNDTMFDLFYQHVDFLHQRTVTEGPFLPRKRKAPRWFEVREGEDYYSPLVEEYYRKLYHEALNSQTLP